MSTCYVVKEAGGKLSKISHEFDRPKSDQVEIKVESCGVCHSDVSIINNEWGISVYPCVPGHEVVGTVSSKGDSVTSFDIGQRVGLGWHAEYCNNCEWCKTGQHNLCPQAKPTIVGRFGGFAEKVIAQASAVVPIPDGVDTESVGPLLCGGITVFNPLVQFDVKPTDKVAVLGIGGLGHLALQFLNAWGCKVTAFTSSKDKIQEAKKLGAYDTLNSKDNEQISSAKGRFDLILVTVNVPLDWNLFLSTLRPKGRLHFVGAVTKPLDIKIFPMMMGQLSVSSSPAGSPATITKMLDFCALHKIKPMIEEYKFENVNDALDRLENGKPHYRVVLIH